MINFDLARKEMIEKQIINRGIHDTAVTEAMELIPRHLFVPADNKEHSYDDSALPIGYEQTISQPYIVALMTQLLHPQKTDVILEIGTGSGYQTAVLSRLCKHVISIEKIPELVTFSRANLSSLNIDNVSVLTGDGTLGWKNNAPYDGIIVTAGAKEIPNSLVSQLKSGGRMVIPVADGHHHKLCLIKMEKDHYIKEEIIDCIFVPLVGRGYNGEA